MRIITLLKASSAIVAVVAALLQPAIARAADDSMTVTLLGTGTPILNVNRFGMSTLVEAGTQKLIFDVGRGASIRLHQLQVPLRDIDAVFITHLHSDHLTGLPDLYATAPLPTDDGRRTGPLQLYGPAGIKNVANGIRLMFTDNNRIRESGKEVAVSATSIGVHELPDKGGIVYQRDGVVVRAFLVDHGHVQSAYGYRVEYVSRGVCWTLRCAVGRYHLLA